MTLTCGAGWRFVTPDEELPGENTVPDPLHPNYTHLRDIYFSNDPNYTGRFTVPVLFDKKTDRIVSNEVWNEPTPASTDFPVLLPLRILTKTKTPTELGNHSHALLRV